MLNRLRVETGKPVKFYCSNPVREDGSEDQGGSSRDGEKQSNSGYILRV